MLLGTCVVCLTPLAEVHIIGLWCSWTGRSYLYRCYRKKSALGFVQNLRDALAGVSISWWWFTLDFSCSFFFQPVAVRRSCRCNGRFCHQLPGARHHEPVAIWDETKCWKGRSQISGIPTGRAGWCCVMFRNHPNYWRFVEKWQCLMDSPPPRFNFGQVETHPSPRFDARKGVCCSASSLRPHNRCVPNCETWPPKRPPQKGDEWVAFSRGLWGLPWWMARGVSNYWYIYIYILIQESQVIKFYNLVYTPTQL